MLRLNLHGDLIILHGFHNAAPIRYPHVEGV